MTAHSPPDPPSRAAAEADLHSDPCDPGAIDLEPGSLWPRARAASDRAQRSGAQKSLATTGALMEREGIQYVVRSQIRPRGDSDATRAPRSNSTSRPRSDNPFLPYDPELFVADVSPTHVCLLNKFNILDDHILVVTRSFIDQNHPLEATDLAALWACMDGRDCLGFYNGGADAGASQPHRHMQIVPLPLHAAGAPKSGAPRLPIDPLIHGARPVDPALHAADALPFAHTIARLDPDQLTSPRAAGTHLWRAYRAMLGHLGLYHPSQDQPRPYNLLVTSGWMLVVPRSREHSGPMSINSLGFGGSFLVRDAAEHEHLRQRGPLGVLREVSTPPHSVGDAPG